MLIDFYKYLAKYPLHAGVQKNFANTTSKLAQWAEIKSDIDSMVVKSLLPDIKDFIFSINTEMIFDKIRSLDSYFMFAEYGQVQNTMNDHNLKKTGLQLAITLAHNFSWNNKDTVEELAISNKCLYLLRQIEAQMETDNADTCSALKYLEFPATITPIEPMNFNGAIGWVMSFNANATYTNF